MKPAWNASITSSPPRQRQWIGIVAFSAAAILFAWLLTAIIQRYPHEQAVAKQYADAAVLQGPGPSSDTVRRRYDAVLTGHKRRPGRSRKDDITLTIADQAVTVSLPGRVSDDAVGHHATVERWGDDHAITLILLDGQELQTYHNPNWRVTNSQTGMVVCSALSLGSLILVGLAWKGRLISTKRHTSARVRFRVRRRG